MKMFRHEKCSPHDQRVDRENHGSIKGLEAWLF